MRIIVAGSRDWVDVALVERVLNEYFMHCARSSTHITIVHGACPTGADAMADAWALRRGIRVERHPAEWNRLGRSAGPARNAEMADLGADVCIAFQRNMSRGTMSMVNEALRAGIHTRIYPSTT